MKVRFEGPGDFEAYHKARAYCTGQGLLIGPMQRDDPIGLSRGHHPTLKWRHLDIADIAKLDGVMTGDKRNGPVTVEMFNEGAA